MARAADFFLSDDVIITGQGTGLPANIDEICAVKKAVDLPVLIGSGVTVENTRPFPHVRGCGLVPDTVPLPKCSVVDVFSSVLQ